VALDELAAEWFRGDDAEAAGIGQEAVADKAGRHRTPVSRLERGKRNPTLEVITKRADTLGTTTAALREELEVEKEQPAAAAALQAEPALGGGTKQSRPGRSGS
jgi:transcriptional regulator with XRE-family HTH domain